MRPRVPGVCGFVWRRWLVSASAGWLLCAFPAAAHGHGSAPAVLSLVSADAEGAQVVRLNAGIALRESGGTFRLLCPAAWGDDVARSTLAWADGRVVVFSDSGPQLLAATGKADAHPDPEAAGPAIDAVTMMGRVYVLRPSGAGSEIIELTAERALGVWTDDQVWTSLAAGADFLALARLDDEDRLEVLQLTSEGEVTLRQQVAAPAGCSSVLVCVLDDALYLNVAWNGGRQLGRIADGHWLLLQGALSSIAGPLAIAEDQSVVAVDGALSRFPNSEPAQTDAAGSVSCLGRIADQAYACTREGVRALGPLGLGDVLFDLSRLRAPDLTQVPEVARERCAQQWLHLRLDLLSVGITLPDDTPSTGSAGQPAADGGKRSNQQAAKSVASGGGCDCSMRSATARAQGLAAWLALGVALGQRVIRRRRSRLLTPRAAASNVAIHS